MDGATYCTMLINFFFWFIALNVWWPLHKPKWWCQLATNKLPYDAFVLFSVGETDQRQLSIWSLTLVMSLPRCDPIHSKKFNKIGQIRYCEGSSVSHMNAIIFHFWTAANVLHNKHITWHNFELFLFYWIFKFKLFNFPAFIKTIFQRF